MARTIRVYVDGSPTPAATITQDEGEPRYAVPLHGLTGTHTIRVTGQIDGEGESVMAQRSITLGPFDMLAPIAVEGATQAKLVVQRAMMRHRVDATFAESFEAGYTYQNGVLWMNDITHGMQPFPGYWTWQKVRPFLDRYASHIGEFLDPVTSAVVPTGPQSLALNGSVSSWKHASRGRWPDMSKASDMALMAIYCHRLGDPTAWSTYRDVAATAMRAFPHQAFNGGKLVYSDPALDVIGGGNTYVWWDEGVRSTGYLANIAAAHCRAWLLMRDIATERGETAKAAEYQAEVDALILGLRGLRITSGEYAGFYYANSNDPESVHVPTTAYVVAFGLCDSTERAASAQALVDMYLAGRLTVADPGGNPRGGYFALLVHPKQWTQMDINSSHRFGHWSTEVIGPAIARSFQIAGRSDLAAEWMQRAVDELLYQHRYGRNAPFEILTESEPAGLGHWTRDDLQEPYEEYGSYLQVFAGTWLIHAREALPATVDLTLSGATGSESAALDLPHGHLFSGFDVICEGASTVTVELLGREDGYRSGVLANAIYLPMGEATLAAAAQGSTDDVVPLAAFGGSVKARIASGSAAGTVTVRLKNRPTRVPSLITPAAIPVDEFAADTRSSYRLHGDAAWAFGGGSAANSGTAAAHAICRAVRPGPDARIKAAVRLGATTRGARLYLRWRDESNWIAAELRDKLYFYRCAGGAVSQLALANVTVSPGALYTLEAEAAGTTFRVWLDGTLRVSSSTADVFPGLAGFGTSAGAGTVTFENFEVVSRSSYVPPGFLVENGGPSGSKSGHIGDDNTATLGTGTFIVRSPEGHELVRATGTGMVAR